MESYLKHIVIIILILNALFWGLGNHQQHCKIASIFGISKCPPHYVHILIGVISFLSAILLAQYDYIFS